MATFLIAHPLMNILGGAERVFHNVVKGLVENDQRVRVLSSPINHEQYIHMIGEDIPKEAELISFGGDIVVKPPFCAYKRQIKIKKLISSFKDDDFDYIITTQNISSYESELFKKAKNSIAYIHFPEAHDDYKAGTIGRKIYLWPYMKHLESGIDRIDLMFCNSLFTKNAIYKYWNKKIKTDPVVIYPPVDLKDFWCDTPISERPKRVSYVGRLIPRKRHEIMKSLARDLPDYEFVSMGAKHEGAVGYYENLIRNSPPNYQVKSDLTRAEMIDTLKQSRINVHLYTAEHFGIGLHEGLAAGCVAIPHKSGGSAELAYFIPEWGTRDDLKAKIVDIMENQQIADLWRSLLPVIWSKIGEVEPENFRSIFWDKLLEGGVQP